MPMLLQAFAFVGLYYTEEDTRRDPKGTLLSGLFIVRPNMLLASD